MGGLLWPRRLEGLVDQVAGPLVSVRCLGPFKFLLIPSLTHLGARTLGVYSAGWDVEVIIQNSKVLNRWPIEHPHMIARIYEWTEAFYYDSTMSAYGRYSARRVKKVRTKCTNNE